MVNILIVTLGDLGEALVASTECILGKSPRLDYQSVAWDADLADADAEVARKLDALVPSGCVMLTDLAGSTATNACMRHWAPGLREVVTGVNLAMAIKAHRLAADIDVARAAEVLRDQARAGIGIAGTTHG